MTRDLFLASAFLLPIGDLRSANKEREEKSTDDGKIRVFITDS